MRKNEESVRWYDRGRWPYQADRNIVKAYAQYFEQVDWKLFCTLTFAGKVTDLEADVIFADFINRLERTFRCDVGYVRGDDKRLSGCGKPASGRHFHVLLACAAPISTAYVEYVWKSLAGKGCDDDGAKAEPYDNAQNGVAYVMKCLIQEHGEWRHRKLHLFHPEARSLHDDNARTSRNIRRHRARQQQFRKCNPVAIGND
jgi:hypothetical protein